MYIFGIKCVMVGDCLWNEISGIFERGKQRPPVHQTRHHLCPTREEGWSPQKRRKTCRGRRSRYGSRRTFRRRFLINYRHNYIIYNQQTTLTELKILHLLFFATSSYLLTIILFYIFIINIFTISSQSYIFFTFV